MIEGTTGTNLVGAASSVGYTEALTPDALLVYCATRLRDIDAKVQEKFSRQKGYREASGALNELQAEFVRLSQPVPPERKGLAITDAEQGARDKIDAIFQRAIDAAPPDKRGELQQAFDRWKVNPGDDGYLVEEVKTMAADLERVTKTFSDSAEIDMIELQSLMSQRQTAVQLVTNLLGSLNDAAKAIVAKIGAS